MEKSFPLPKGNPRTGPAMQPSAARAYKAADRKQAPGGSAAHPGLCSKSLLCRGFSKQLLATADHPSKKLRKTACVKSQRKNTVTHNGSDRI